MLFGFGPLLVPRDQICNVEHAEMSGVCRNNDFNFSVLTGRTYTYSENDSEHQREAV